MSSALSSDFKELVRARTDLVALIGQTVTLQAQRGGREFVGLCPFHEDHHPSMRVNPERQSFMCWSCKSGGDCFQFVMLRDRVEFREALEILADRARLDMPKGNRGPDRDNPLAKQRLFEVVAWAESLFHETLLKSPVAAVARDYLAERGLTQATVLKFRLGYHPNDWEWLLKQARGKYSPEQLLAARLIGERDQGRGYYDNYVDRVLFPIRDGQSRPVAFGGRILPGANTANGAKYWNGPESSLFEKSRLLYGLDLAREGIRHTDTAVVMEGYTDCIMAHQCGVTNAVATLGTALTEANVANLKRFARKVVLVYDGDEAGQNASEKALAKFLAQEVDLRILTLPGDVDPADVLLKQGKEWFESLLAQAPEVWDFKFQRVVERYGLATIDARHQVLKEMLETLCQVPVSQSSVVSGSTPAGAWQVREDLMLGRLSQRLGLTERNVRQALTDLRKERPRRGEKPQAVNAPHSHPSVAQIQRLMRHTTKEERLECELLEIALTHPDMLDAIRREVALDDIGDPNLRRLLEMFYQLAEGDRPANGGPIFSYERLMSELEDSALKRLATFLDDSGRKKQLGPEMLDVILKCFQRRRELGLLDGGLSGGGLPGGAVPETEIPSPPDSAEMLRRSMELNRKRVSHNPGA